MSDCPKCGCARHSLHCVQCGHNESTTEHHQANVRMTHARQDRGFKANEDESLSEPRRQANRLVDAASDVVEAQRRFLNAPDGARSLHASHRLSEKIEHLRKVLDGEAES